MRRSITTAANVIAAAVTATVIAGQLFRRKSLAAMQPYFWFCEHLFDLSIPIAGKPDF